MPNRNHINHPNVSVEALAKSDHRNHSSGYTLAEMIIVITIIAVLGAIGSRTYFAERDRFEFNNALTKTMQLIKTVRTYATTSYPIYIKDDINKNIIPFDGYGIQVNINEVRGLSTLKIFANVGPGPDVQNFQEDNDPNGFDESDILLETYTLPKQIDLRYFLFSYYNGTPPALVADEPQWKISTTTEPAGPTVRQAIMMFKPPLGDMSIVDNLQKPLEQLVLQFQNPATDAEGPKKCQRIIVNRVKAFPELMYESTCF